MDTNSLHALWRHLHANPEVSWQEKETTTYLMDYCRGHGLEPVAFQEVPGFYVDIGAGKPVVGLRADMDALLQEVNGQQQANHSCGHDAHMTMVMAALLRLKAQESDLKGTVRAIFQPAEELGNGAEKVVEEGVVDHLDYLFGVHVRPQNEIAFPACAPAIEHGGCLFIRGEISGMDHHGARPHEGVNAIELAYLFLQHVQNMHISPMIPASAKMTNIHAGTDHLNVIPGEATFGLDVRSQSNEALQEMKQGIEKIADQLGALYETEIHLRFEDELPAAMIHVEAEQIMEKAIRHCLGSEQTKQRIRTTGSDDFHFYTKLRPHIKATMLALGADVVPGLHHPYMTFEKKAMENGAAILEQACLLVFEQENIRNWEEGRVEERD